MSRVFRRICWGRPAGLVCGLVACWAGGCAPGPHYIAVDDRTVIDRTEIEYPQDMQMTPLVGGLTAPCAIGFETDDAAHKGSLIIAESGLGTFTGEPQIFGFKPNGEMFPIYPRFTRIPLVDDSFRLNGPVSGMALKNGKIYVAHHDAAGFGIITALDYEGHHSTVVSDLPATGDYGVTDVAIHPNNGRLYFGLGATTNSGVVGLDNWETGWVDSHPDAADRPYAPFADFKLNGYRFTTPNPKGGLFGGDDIAVTAPFQAFGTSQKLRIPANTNRKPTAAIYSVDIGGGDLRVEAHGLRLPRGLVFNDYGNLFVTNDGMELRGTRPVKDDPDVVLRVVLGGQVWFGFPDYSADLIPISDARFQPPAQVLMRTGYPELAPLIDHEASGLTPPDQTSLLRGKFSPLSGAAKMAFVPDQSADAFKPFRGQLLVALSGDRAPFATGGQPLVAPQGYTVKAVDLDFKKVTDFVANTKRVPASMIPKADLELERPIDVKFGPDGALYIVDYGHMEMKHGRERVESKTGRIYRLGPPAVPSTEPAPTGKAARPRNYQE